MKKPVNRATLRRFAARHGVEIVVEPGIDDAVFELVAPAGMIFGEEDLHILVWTEWKGGTPADYSPEIDSILSLEPCTDSDCEHCHPED